MKLIKKISLLSLLTILILGSVIYGYKLGVDDSATLVYFSEAGINYAHLKILNEKGVDRLREFIESDIDLAISIHKNMNKKQSFFSQLIGPENIKNKHRDHYLNYYRGILEYKKLYPSKNNQSNVLKDLEELIDKENEN